MTTQATEQAATRYICGGCDGYGRTSGGRVLCRVCAETGIVSELALARPCDGCGQPVLHEDGEPARTECRACRTTASAPAATRYFCGDCGGPFEGGGFVYPTTQDREPCGCGDGYTTDRSRARCCQGPCSEPLVADQTFDGDDQFCSQECYDRNRAERWVELQADG